MKRGTWIVALLFVLIAGGIVSGVMLYRKLTPLVEIDQKQGRIRLLGGIIDLDTSKNSVIVNGKQLATGGTNRVFEGSRPLPKGGDAKIVFTMGNLRITSSPDAVVHWNCKLGIAFGDPFLDTSKGGVEIDLKKIAGANCDLGIPPGTHLAIVGTQGVISLDKPSFHLNMALNQGTVIFTADPARKYNFDTTLVAGGAKGFPTSKDAGALQMRVSLINGTLIKE